ncbi:fimbrial protein [Phytobacter diazotrophicus]|uniref:fimbrial protein n=1 Tax=Phytobacter diazotrophicus TaxID=395631 RepID=UPI00232C2058|nr:fimbrial protein [Phytobacter diazotrophicus]MDC0726460.1 fimbrial protein [Phytobacter diazotrophicus]MDC0733693.1 fimbrial protein [Phytobacter diazotrophicus]
MKKLLLVASATAAISLVNTASAATSGTVNFSGKLSDQTCQVLLNNGTSASGTVTLPTVPKERFPSKYSTTGNTGFTLKLMGCKASSTAFGVLAYFPPSSYIQKMNNYFSFLKNLETGPTAAQGIYLSIYQMFGATEKQIKLGEPITDASYQYTTVAANATSTTLTYTVKYIRWDDGVTAGKVKGMAVYELAYQ